MVHTRIDNLKQNSELDGEMSVSKIMTTVATPHPTSRGLRARGHISEPGLSGVKGSWSPAESGTSESQMSTWDFSQLSALHLPTPLFS